MLYVSGFRYNASESGGINILLSEFDNDFNNVWSNACSTMLSDTVYYRAAVLYTSAGRKILDGPWSQVDSAGVSSCTGSTTLT